MGAWAASGGPEFKVGGHFARYRIDGLVGRGSMGVVLRALDTVLRRTVALKVLAEPLASDPVATEAFLAEMHIIASLDHPSILPVYDAGVVDGQAYLAMRYVPGRDLGRVLRDDGPLVAGEMLAIGRQVAAGLDAAHRRGVLHGDVKPSNILVANGPDTISYLADFGLSLARIDRSRPVEMGGSHGFVAPEMLMGGAVDGRADQYGLARVFARCLGVDPDGADQTGATADSATRSAAAILRRGLAFDPLDRYPTCSDLVAALARTLTPSSGSSVPAATETASAGAPGLTRVPGTVVEPASAVRGRGRRGFLASSAAVLLIASAAGGLGLAGALGIPGSREPTADPSDNGGSVLLGRAWAAAAAAGIGTCPRALTRGGERRCPPMSVHCRPQLAGVQLVDGGALNGVRCEFSLDQPLYNLFVFTFANSTSARIWWNYEVGEFGATGPTEDACSGGHAGRRSFVHDGRSGVVGCWFAPGAPRGSPRWWLAWHEEDSHLYGLISGAAVPGDADEHSDMIQAIEAWWRTMPEPLGAARPPISSTAPAAS